MKALKSDNPTNAQINKNFFIRVMLPDEKKNRLTSAKQCIKFIQDEEIKIKLFKKVLEGREQNYTFKIRNRLTINFHSK